MRSVQMALLAGALVAGFCAFAAEGKPPSRLEEIVVRSLRLDPGSLAVGTNFTVITAEDIAARGVHDVADVLPSVSGVTINKSGSFGGFAQAKIRGAGADQTLVLIDNVVVNDAASPGGGYDLSRLDAGNVERIEVLKGAHSTLWGTDAIGGVINILTKTPTEGLGVDASVEYGSFDTFRLSSSLASGSAAGGFRVGLVRKETEGISKADQANGNSEKDSYENTTLSFRGGLNLPLAAKLNFSLLSIDSKSEYDSFSATSQGSVADGEEVGAIEELSTQISLDFHLWDEGLKNQLLIARSEIERKDMGSFSARFKSERTLYRYQGNLVTERYQLAFGAEREVTETLVKKSGLDSLFVFYQHHFDFALVASIGLRADLDRRGEDNTTFRLNLSYPATDWLSLYGGFGEGFKAPTIYQRNTFFPPAGEANGELKSATSKAFDLGLRVQPSSDISFSVNWFRQDTRNLISYIAGRYENLDEVTSSGVELGADISLNAALKLQAGYALIDARDGNSSPLIRVPKRTASLELSFLPTKATRGNLLLYYNDKEDGGAATVPSWYRLDFSFQQQVGQHLSLFVRIENLLDEDYQQVLGYGTPNRSLSAGVKFVLR